MPCYLHFLPEVVSAGEELVQCALRMLHVATVLSVDQEPKEEAATCTQRNHMGTSQVRCYGCYEQCHTAPAMCTHTRTHGSLQCPDSFSGRLESFRVTAQMALLPQLPLLPYP